MVAVVNSVVIGAGAGLLLEALGVDSLTITLAAGAIIGVATWSIQRAHHRRARDAHRIDAIDRAAILVPDAAAATLRLEVRDDGIGGPTRRSRAAGNE
jgi:hypothetical protein